MSASPGLRVTVVHDYLTQRGGAERVALDLLDAFPGATLVTSCWDPGTTYPEFARHDVRTLWPNAVPFLRADPRRAFPFLADAFERTVLTDTDLVVCSSSGWAHRIGTTAPKIVYCHNPPRWLYQPHDYLHVVPAWLRRTFVAATRSMRRSDVDAAKGADLYLANSRGVATRIEQTYGREAPVVHPARGLDPHGPQEPVPEIEPGFLLTVGRTRGYKNTDTACRAVEALPDERLVVVGDLPDGVDSPRIRAVSEISDAGLRWLYANASGLVASAIEDFGLTVVEAQAFGVPTVTLRAGGYLDSVSEGVTGVFVDTVDPAALAEGIRALRAMPWDPARIRAHGARFSASTFRAEMQEVAATVVAGRRSAPAVRDALFAHRARTVVPATTLAGPLAGVTQLISPVAARGAAVQADPMTGAHAEQAMLPTAV